MIWGWISQGTHLRTRMRYLPTVKLWWGRDGTLAARSKRGQRTYLRQLAIVLRLHLYSSVRGAVASALNWRCSSRSSGGAAGTWHDQSRSVALRCDSRIYEAELEAVYSR